MDNSFDELPDELKEFNKEFPPLEEDEVWAATLKISVVNFPSPAHARAFFQAMSAMIEQLSNKLDMIVIESTTGLGKARKVGNDNPKPPKIIDWSKFKN